VPINFKKHKIKENKTDDDMNISDELKETKFEIKLKEILISDYIEKKINENGKKYTKTKLIFEGEYLYGKKWKGKEYFNGKLIFEGKYLYDYKKEGKEYINEKLEFEGEYLKGKNGMEKDMMKMGM